jgi:hypothetical protein
MLDKERLEQMDNEEYKRRDIAERQYEKLNGRARVLAIKEEKRRRQEHAKQRQQLFPDDTSSYAAAVQVSGPVDVTGKGKQRAIDPDLISPAPTTSLDPVEPSTSLSTDRPSGISERPSPVSSTSSPPSLGQKARTRTFSRNTKQETQYFTLTTEKFRIHSIPPFFYADRACTAYAAPLPDLKRVMELGVWHTASVS